MSAAIYEALLYCDEQLYLPGGDLPGATTALRAIVAQDPAEARVMLDNLQGCRRTVYRHSRYLREALQTVQGQAASIT